MIKPSKAMIAGAAVAGLLTGSFAVRAYAAGASGHAGVNLWTDRWTDRSLTFDHLNLTALCSKLTT